MLDEVARRQLRDLLTIERGLTFGPQIAANLKRRRQAPSPRWHLDDYNTFDTQRLTKRW